MALNMSAVEMARQRAEQQGGGGNLNFFKLDEGQKTYLRFLTGMVDYKVVSHSCGLNMYDYRKEKWDEESAAGAQHLCPNCGQPLTDENVMYDRPEPLLADLHNYFPTSDVNKHASFVCLASETNAAVGIVPADENGHPKYQCPACACQHNKRKEDGKPKRPTLRMYGIAVERQVEMGQEMVNGIMTPVVKGVSDVMVEEDGKKHPRIVIVQMSWNNFWQKLSNFDNSYENSICLYDWAVQRNGSGLNTSYDLQPVNQGAPNIVDMREYAEWIPDVKKLLSSQGDPKYYVQKGYQVIGYVPEGAPAQNAAGTAQAALQNAGMPVQQAAPAYNGVPQQAQQAIPVSQPMQPQAIPMAPQAAQGGSNDWSVVQNQFS